MAEKAQNNIKPCHYYNNEKLCPYDELGCKFLHSVADKCKFGQKCKRRLCPNRYEKRGNLGSDIDSTIDNAENGEIFETETDFDTIMTSTPKRRTFNCEECIDGLQCMSDRQSGEKSPFVRWIVGWTLTLPKSGYSKPLLGGPFSI